ATSTIPIVFVVGIDPVQIGLVASLNRPGGNLTGFNQISGELGAKALQVLHELLPAAAPVGFLANPKNPIAEVMRRGFLAAGRALTLEARILYAGTEDEIDAAFASLAQTRTGAMVVSNDIFLNGRVPQLVAVAARHAIPTISTVREFALAGGLMSYGTSL